MIENNDIIKILGGLFTGITLAFFGALINSYFRQREQIRAQNKAHEQAEANRDKDYAEALARVTVSLEMLAKFQDDLAQKFEKMRDEVSNLIYRISAVEGVNIYKSR